MLINRALQAALAAAGLAVAQGPAYAQQSTDVTVETSQIRQGFQAIGRIGEGVRVVSASGIVNHADLDLTTHSGARTLEKRIRDAAKQVCAQLARQEPLSADGNPPCVKGAIENGMLQARALIAAAKAQARERLEANAAIATTGVTEQR
jgi:UrcA family protein